ncbi:MAG TPA: hypothetical protein VGN26_14605 [Armatimonadota bacterium]|jgi:hypothetical protein
MRPEGEALRWERRDSGAVPERRVDTPEGADGEWRVGKSPWWLRASAGEEGPKASPRVYGRHAGWLILLSGSETCRVKVESDLRAPRAEWLRGALRALPALVVGLVLSALASLVSLPGTQPESAADTAKFYASAALGLSALPVTLLVLSVRLRGRSGLLPSLAGVVCGLLLTAGLTALVEPRWPIGELRGLMALEAPLTGLGALVWAAIALGPRTGPRVALSACAACVAVPVLLYPVTLVLMGAFPVGGPVLMLAAVQVAVVLAICAWGADLCGYLAPVRGAR